MFRRNHSSTAITIVYLWLKIDFNASLRKYNIKNTKFIIWKTYLYRIKRNVPNQFGAHFILGGPFQGEPPIDRRPRNPSTCTAPLNFLPNHPELSLGDSPTTNKKNTPVRFSSNPTCSQKQRLKIDFFL